jgi:cold shock CspA family protein
LEIYGFILSLKSTFGFIQSVQEDEQYHFSEREFYINMKIGDKVAFLPRNSQKGMSATNVRLVIPTPSKLMTNVMGVVLNSFDRHHTDWCIVDVDMDTINAKHGDIKNLLETKFKKRVPFRTSDVLVSSMPRYHSVLERGDVVEFTLSRYHDSNFFIATDVKFHQTKRDKLMATQIERMLQAGAIREVGVVSIIKNNEFGFIRAQDRKEELYFRVDDSADESFSIAEVKLHMTFVCDVCRRCCY